MKRIKTILGEFTRNGSVQGAYEGYETKQSRQEEPKNYFENNHRSFNLWKIRISGDTVCVYCKEVEGSHDIQHLQSKIRYLEAYLMLDVRRKHLEVGNTLKFLSWV